MCVLLFIMIVYSTYNALLCAAVCCIQYNSPFGKVEAYEKQEQLGEGSYATVYKGRSL